MIVSSSRNFVFAHVPRTGGISISGALEPFADMPADPAIQTHDTLAVLLARHPETAGHFKFGFVRNPWERLVSFYAHARRYLAPTVPEMQSLDFPGMVRALDRDEPWTRRIFAFRPQRDFFCDENGAQLGDWIGRFERLEQDFRTVCRRIGVSAALPLRNASEHGPYPEYYDARSRDLVRARYRDDIEAFGYAFARDKECAA